MVEGTTARGARYDPRRRSAGIRPPGRQGPQVGSEAGTARSTDVFITVGENIFRCNESSMLVP